jgi:2-polyprenyl-3-methyl-5-hydroxy-6-metoxy-1,4-benzoquinol methylase
MSGLSLPTRSPAPESRDKVRANAVVGFFQCMRCCATLTGGSADALTCAQCGATVSILDGIIDFVGGAATTELDNIDYDEKYSINEEHSLNLYELLMRATGPLWPKNFGDALEIGCGTGGLSLALLSHAVARHVVLTDGSTKMLRQCRARLRAAGSMLGTSTTFASYSATEPCFRPDAFDTCFGTAVVHHITDVPGFLSRVHGLLKPGGCAFFMEPNLTFHRALTATLTDIVAELLRDQSLPDTEISRMLNWAGEVHCNIVNSGDIEVLAEREDKHQFVGETFTLWAKDAGFTPAAALPCDLDPTGWNTIQTYLDQTGVSAEGFAALKHWWPSKHGAHFSRLAENDQSPSYLFWLRKPLHAAAVAVRMAPAAADPAPQSTLPVRMALVLRLDRDDEGLALYAGGWCLSGAPVRSVQIRAGDVARRLPIWRPRPDVQNAMNRDNAYPPLHALCSGIEGVVRLPGAQDDRIEVRVDVVAVDGTLLPARTVALTVGETVDLA